MRRLILALTFSYVACSQQAEALDESERPAPAAAETETAVVEEEPAAEAETTLDPVETCRALVVAAREDNAEAFGALATDAAVEAMAKNEDVTKAVIGAIGSAVCGEATVEGEAASVSVTVGDNTRDIPFTRLDGAWRFDGAAYLERYPLAAEKAPKKGKKGKRRKKRRR